MSDQITQQQLLNAPSGATWRGDSAGWDWVHSTDFDALRASEALSLFENSVHFDILGTYAYAVELLTGQLALPSGGSVSQVIGKVVEESEKQLPPVSEMLASIRASFRITVSDLARILRVRRPTIYAWIDDRWEPKAKHSNRVGRIFRLAQYWAKQNRGSLESEFKKKSPHGRSLFDTLTQKEIADVAAVQLLNYWASKLPIKVTGVPHDSIRAAAMRQGINVAQMDEQQDVIDRLTGKRTSEDR